MGTLLHHVPSSNAPFYSRHWKTQVGLISPFENNIYLDCDILATSSIEEAWSKIREDKLGLALDDPPTLASELGSLDKWSRSPKSEQYYTANVCSPHEAFYNGGVIFWKKSAIANEFFLRWHHEWKVFSGRDQFALLRALAHSGISVVRLPNAFNCRSRYSPTLVNAIFQKKLFVHFLDNKRRFYRFSKEIEKFAAIDQKTRQMVITLLADSSVVSHLLPKQEYFARYLELHDE
jgi:lipopolysaccharide biosynthesis glycosyltransferase